MTCRRIPTRPALALLLATFAAACGNYSNEDLEFMNAIPASKDVTADIPRALMPLNEAELAALTHKTINDFNEPLRFLEAADAIRSFQPNGRIPNGRVWGPHAMENHSGWLWKFTMTRTPEAPEMFSYWFEVQPVGAGDVWTPFLDGWFIATGGSRKGMGYLHIGTDDLVAAQFPLDHGPDGNVLEDLKITYSTAAFPISVNMSLVIYPEGDPASTVAITYHYEAQESGQGGLEFAGTDSKTGWSIGIVSRWLATGRGRADATVTAPAAVGQTRTQCWDDSFIQTYNFTPWSTPADDFGQIENCPDISTL